MILYWLINLCARAYDFCTMLAVSWADLIAVAGAQAVAECDGPIIPVKLGRIDSL